MCYGCIGILCIQEYPTNSYYGCCCYIGTGAAATFSMLNRSQLGFRSCWCVPDWDVNILCPIRPATLGAVVWCMLAGLPLLSGILTLGCWPPHRSCTLSCRDPFCDSASISTWSACWCGLVLESWRGNPGTGFCWCCHHHCCCRSCDSGRHHSASSVCCYICHSHHHPVMLLELLDTGLHSHTVRLCLLELGRGGQHFVIILGVDVVERASCCVGTVHAWPHFARNICCPAIDAGVYTPPVDHILWTSPCFWVH